MVSARFKADVALSAIKKEKTVEELSKQYGIHPTEIEQWQHQLEKNAFLIFQQIHPMQQQKKELLKNLYAMIGQLTVEKKG